MGRVISGNASSASGEEQTVTYYPSQKFGTGKVDFFYKNGTFIVPEGITAVRVRVFGAGAGAGFMSDVSVYSGGAGGGFAIKTINGLTPGASIPVTVGVGSATIAGTGASSSAGGTSSFGAYVSATGGQGCNYYINSVWVSKPGGSGVGGDINTTGGASTQAGQYGCGGASVANIFGNGSDVGGSIGISGTSGSAGAVGSATEEIAKRGGNGLSYVSAPGAVTRNNSYSVYPGGVPQYILPFDVMPLDFIGTGCGGNCRNADFPPTQGVNGGGSGGSNNYPSVPGSVPGGGAGSGSTSPSGKGGDGLVIVEW